MLNMSPGQMGSLAAVPRQSYASKLVDHLRGLAPRLVELRGEAAVQAAIEAAIERAIDQGFSLRGPIRFWVELAFCHGHRFDTDPALPWADSLLLTTGLHENERARLLFEAVQAHDAAAGDEDQAALISSLGVLAQADWEAMLASPRAQAQPTVALVQLFPQRCQALDSARLQALVDAADQACQTHALDHPAARLLLSGLFLGFGHGVIDDPMYPWVGSSLIATKGDAAHRTTALARKARAYVQAAHQHLAS
jgi:hypothetical protein